MLLLLQEPKKAASRHLFKLRNSQAFISQQHDDLESEYSKVLTIKKEQKKEICNLKSDSANLKIQRIKEIEKVDALEQWVSSKSRNSWRSSQ